MEFLAVWLDTNQAYILNAHGETLESLNSGVATREREPGQGNDQGRMGHQFLDPERKKEERYKHEMNQYFREISDLLAGHSILLIAGPGQIKKNLLHYLQQDKRFRNAELKLETTDSMTENQLGAFVRSFYEELAKN